MLDQDISLQEVIQAIKQMKRGKAAGGDDIFNEILIFGGPQMWESVWRLCNQIFKLERIPTDFIRVEIKETRTVIGV